MQLPLVGIADMLSCPYHNLTLSLWRRYLGLLVDAPIAPAARTANWLPCPCHHFGISHRSLILVPLLSLSGLLLAFLQPLYYGGVTCHLPGPPAKHFSGVMFFHVFLFGVRGLQKSSTFHRICDRLPWSYSMSRAHGWDSKHAHLCAHAASIGDR